MIISNLVAKNLPEECSKGISFIVIPPNMNQTFFCWTHESDFGRKGIYKYSNK